MHLKRKKYYNSTLLSTNWGKAYGVILKLSSHLQKWDCLFGPFFIFSSTGLRLNLKLSIKHWHLMLNLVTGSVCNLIITNVQNLMRVCRCFWFKNSHTIHNLFLKQSNYFNLQIIWLKAEHQLTCSKSLQSAKRSKLSSSSLRQEGKTNTSWQCWSTAYV